MNAALISALALQVDWILLASLAVLVGVDCFRNGPARASAIALAFPLATILKGTLPNALFIGQIANSLSTPLLESALFGGLFVGSFFLIHRMTFTFDNGSRGASQALLSGVATSAIVATLWLATPALQGIWHFGPGVQAVFGETYRFWWLALGYTALAFARG